MTDELPPPLGETKGDAAARAITALVGTIPCVGPAIQFALNEVIPNQRLKRIEAYVRILQTHLDELALKTALKTPEGVDLFEEGLWQSARALSDERKEYIARLVATGMTGDELEGQETRHILRILNQIDDSEVIIICSYQHRFKSLGRDDWGFLKANREILGPFRKHMQVSDDERAKESLRRSRHSHLHALGLLDVKETKENDTTYSLSGFGRRLLIYLGIYEK